MAANAQGFMPPNTDVRALEAPVDVRLKQLRAQDYGGQGRSAYSTHEDSAPLFGVFDTNRH